MSVPLIDCPNCNAVWGAGEIEEGRCYACGYPDNEEETDDWDDDDWDDDYDSGWDGSGFRKEKI